MREAALAVLAHVWQCVGGVKIGDAFGKLR
jgi:hypothetical protein